MINDKQFDEILERINAVSPKDADLIRRYVEGLRKEIDDLDIEASVSYGGKKHRRKFDDES